MSRSKIVLIAVVAIAAVAVGAIALNNSKSAEPLKVPKIASAADGYGLVFNANAPVTIDLWEDPQCPACKAFEGASGEFITSLARDGRAKVVFHTLSFIGPESVTAANAGACASDEGKYLEFHKAAYDKQPASENSGAWTDDAMIKLGASVGITSESFKTCVREKSYKTWVETIAKEGVKSNVNQTPTMRFNKQDVDRNAYASPQSLEAILKTLGMK